MTNSFATTLVPGDRRWHGASRRGSSSGVMRTLLCATALAIACSASPASAVGNHKQVLTGGGSGDRDNAMFTGPGLSEVYPGRPSLCDPVPCTPPTDEDPALLRAYVPMPAGVASDLAVSCVRDYAPVSAPDYLEVHVVVQGRSAELQCTCDFDVSTCRSEHGARIRLSDGDKIAVRVNHSLPTGAYHFTYRFLYN